MRWTPKLLATFGIAAGVVLFGLWFATSGGKPPPATAPPAGEPPATLARGGISQTSNRRPFERVRTNRPARAVGSQPAGISATDTNLLADWEETLDATLRLDLEPDALGRKLLELFPRFPADGRVEAAEHIANLLADEDYEAFGRLLADAQTAADVQEVIWLDLLNRPDALKLPLLLRVARNPELAKAADAKEQLQLQLDTDLGDDWDAWQRKIEQQLKDHLD